MTEQEVREVLTGYFIGISGNVADEESVQFSMFARHWVADHPPKPTREQIENLLHSFAVEFWSRRNKLYRIAFLNSQSKVARCIDAICGGNDDV